MNSSTAVTTLADHDFKTILETAEAIPKVCNINEPKGRADLALHRFVMGLERHKPIDALLDFTISLEALLLPEDKIARRGDLTYRFCTHGAYYLAEEPDQRQKIFDEMSTIYKLRSDLVHGGKYPAANDISVTRDICI